MRKKSTINRKVLKKLSRSDAQRLAQLGTLADNPAWEFLQTCLQILPENPASTEDARLLVERLLQEIKVSLNQPDSSFFENFAQALSDYISMPKLNGQPVSDPLAFVLLKLSLNRTPTAREVVEETWSLFKLKVTRRNVRYAAESLGISLALGRSGPVPHKRSKNSGSSHGATSTTHLGFCFRLVA